MAVVLFSFGSGPLDLSTSREPPASSRDGLGGQFPVDQFNTVIEAMNVTVSHWNMNWKALLAYMDLRISV